MLEDKPVFKESHPQIKQIRWTFSPQKIQHKVYSGFKHWVAGKATVSAAKQIGCFWCKRSPQIPARGWTTGQGKKAPGDPPHSRGASWGRGHLHQNKATSSNTWQLPCFCSTDRKVKNSFWAMAVYNTL